ncbi:MAG: HAMP domain-containing sensor histidine kinase [Bdellovibrionales bacterium]
MIIRPFFRRHFWRTALVFFSILTGASYLSHYLNHLDRSDFYKTQGELFLNVVEKHGSQLSYIRELNATNRALGIPVEVEVIQGGKSLLTGDRKEVPSTTDTSEKIYTHVITLPDNPVPATFVVDYVHGGPKHGMTYTFLIMSIAIFLASTLSMFLLFWSFRDRAELAKNVLLRMQNGDLKARFPTTKLDEVGHMMALFNQMADEIERLVERLQANETHRLQLLQELTHDLRTPVSSLRNLIETLRFEEARLEPKAKVELMDLAYQETEYLTRLVEDLLFLALVLEPKYKAETGEVSMNDVIEAQVAATSAAHPQVRSEFVKKPTESRRHIMGNAHLMQRLIRNGLENAYSFASSNVQTAIHCAGEFLSIVIRDDGPGLSDEALESFGKKRSTRYQGPGQDGRLSVGLGSVIMQAIASAHGGQVTIQNIYDSQGQVKGSELNITIRATTEGTHAT